MNNPKNTADQVVVLQNIAYVKQFMQKTSIKLLAVVAFLQAILVGYTMFKFTDIFKTFVTFASKISPEFAGSSGDMLIQFDLFMGALSTVFMVVGILAVAFSLILPVTLIYIIIRSANDNPSVVPAGAVKFLKVLSAIQLVLMIISGVLSLVGAVITMINGNAVQNTSAFTTTMTTANSPLANIISIVFSVISVLISVFYYYLQFKFLSSVHTSAKGNVLLYAGAKGYGVYSVVFAIIMGIYLVGFSIFLIIMGSILNSNTLMSDDAAGTIFMQSIDIIMPLFILMFVSIALSFLYQVLLAVVAFGFKNTVSEAIRASYATAQGVNPYNRAAATGNSPFRTYGGNNSYSNYNYNISNNMSQSSGQTAANGSGSTSFDINKSVPEKSVSQEEFMASENANNNSSASMGFYGSGNQESNSAPQESYSAPQNTYNTPQESYGAPQNTYNTPQESYGAPQNTYNAPQESYSAPQNTYNAPQESYSAPQNTYNAPTGFYGQQSAENNINLNKEPEPAVTTSYNDNPYNNYGDDTNF
ncbi:MAG: hypothetical protein UH241_04495 [Acutalibacteraceae bacterium]|nr:hypothetical protein [Acutalibacteraceae bacterium]